MAKRTKLCVKCRKPGEFYANKKNKDGLESICKKCKKKHREQPRVKRREQYKRRRRHLKTKYGISLEDFNEIFEKQGGKCAICGTKDPGGRHGTFHVDHNHDTGVVRGLLCYRCNVELPHIKKWTQWIIDAGEYLLLKGRYED